MKVFGKMIISLGLVLGLMAPGLAQAADPTTQALLD